MKERGQGRPDSEKPKIKEQGGIHKEGAANIHFSPTEPKIGRTVFDCIAPEVIPSPFHIRRMLRDRDVTEEQAQELEQKWLGELKTMDRKSLEGEVSWWKEMRDRFAKEQKLEEVQEIEQQLEVLRKQLRSREVTK